jgi:dipeptidyl aminopeptidase/acylaminoacyl peptidase
MTELAVDGEVANVSLSRIPRSAPAMVTAPIAALVLAACDTGLQNDERPTDPDERPPGSALSTRRTEVQFPTADGVLLSGSLTLPQRTAPVIVLIHQLGSDRHDWDGFVPALDRAGFATLAYDTRGMGRSLSRWPGKQRYFPPPDEERYLETMPRDVAAALRFLQARRRVDAERIAVVGAGHGANVAYASSAAARATVALSPVTVRDALRPRGRSPRGVLFISSRLEAAAVLDLAQTVTEPRLTMLASDPEGHGVALLRELAVRRAILDWLRSHLFGERRAAEGR